MKYKNDELDDEISKLRESGYSYRDISKYYAERGIQISYEAIFKRCKRIYREKEEPEIKKERKVNLTPNNDEFSDDSKINEKIFELREQKYSYERIAQYFSCRGIRIGVENVKRRCNEIYKKKGIEEPVIQRPSMGGALDEEIVKLRKQGYTYELIAIHFQNEGIMLGISTIGEVCRNKCKGEEAYNKSKEERIANNKELKKRALLSLKKTKNATDEQLKQLAELYGVDFDVEESMEK